MNGQSPDAQTQV